MMLFPRQRAIFYQVFCILLFIFSSATSDEGRSATTRLHNGLVFPLNGLGVGNLQHELIPEIITEGLQHGILLIDTAHASHNEAIIDEAISKSSSSKDMTVHVVTKVWYTHLGYERTKLSVQESIDAFETSHPKIHMLLHWPRCRTDIAWMDCAGEEAALPELVKGLGPAPHLSPDTAFLEAWTAMEELYGNGRLASIGISNFDVQDLQSLLQVAKVVPHIIQINVWSILFDPELIRLCREHHIHIQVYNVMNGIFSQPVPNAMHSLQQMTESLDMVAPQQLVLAWLMQQEISVIPRTTRHVADNAMTATMLLSEEQMSNVETAVAALLQGRDLELPKATFVSKHSAPVSVYWKHHETGEELSVKSDLQPGESFHSNTYPGHVFVVYETGDESSRREYQITAMYGDEENFHIEL